MQIKDYPAYPSSLFALLFPMVFVVQRQHATL
jgi:hypothetical protein